MKTLVLDASVALRWFLDKIVPPYATRVRQLLTSGTRALVPALWHLEMGNALVVAERRRIISAADAGLALTNIEQLLTVAIDTDLSSPNMRSVVSLATHLRLSTYDASYLDLAKRESLPLATLDDQLRAAAKHSAVEIV